MKQILIVEDDELLNKMLVYNFLFLLVINSVLKLMVEKLFHMHSHYKKC